MQRWPESILIVCVLSAALIGCGPKNSRPVPPPVAARPGELPVQAFAALPLIQDMALSPQGDYLAFIENTEGHSALVSQQRSGGESRVLVSTDNQKFHIRGFTWVNNQRLLVRLWYPVRIADLKLTQSRLIAINRDASELKTDLVKIDSQMIGNQPRIPQFQDSYALIPGDDRHILLMMDDQRPGVPNVFKLDVFSGERETVVANPGYVRRWLADLQGHVRVGVGIVGTRTVRVVHRPVGDDEWRVLFEYDALSNDSMEPLGFDADPDVLYLRGLHQGKAAIFRLQLSAPLALAELVFADPHYDVEGSLIYAADGNRVLGVHYTAAHGTNALWDDAARIAQAKAEQVFPNRDIAVASSVGNQSLILVSGASTAPAYYGWNTASNQTVKLVDVYPPLAEQALSPTETVHFKTRDGLELEGYLTRSRPAGNAPGPAIIFPHGGPWSRDQSSFNPWTQFLANRGWQVLQINFRGSAGYGADFEAAGFRRWGLEMQDDITDGVRWLVDQKLADPATICIVGGSYGGYAALMGAIKTPELYRCAISLAPVTDLQRLLNDWSDMRFLDHHLRSELAERVLGNWWSDRKRLEQTSPAEQASRLHTPLLLAHGTGDWIVDVSHSRAMANALERAGFKDFSYLELEDADHYLTREQDRLRFFSEMDAFLRRFH